MEIKRITEDENNTFNNVINPSLIRDGDIVEGLALVQKVTNGVTSSEKPVVRFYLRGQYNLVVQANMYLPDRKVFKNEDALEFLNQIVYIKGISNIFGSNRCIIELSNIQKFKSDLKPQNFFATNELVSVYEPKLQKIVEELKNNGYTNPLFESNATNIYSILTQRLDSEEGCLVGDWLIITTRVLEDLLGYATKPDYASAYLGLVYFILDCMVNDADFEGNNNSMSSIWIIDKIIKICERYNLLLNQTQKDTFYNLIGTVYCNETALTHIAKVINNGIPYYKKFLISTNFEYTPELVHRDSHLKMR